MGRCSNLFDEDEVSSMVADTEEDVMTRTRRIGVIEDSRVEVLTYLPTLEER